MAVGRSDSLPVSGARPIGYEQLASLAAAASPTIPAGARWMEINVEGQPVRIRYDGTPPTTTVGMLYPVGASFFVDTRFLISANVDIIETAPSAKVNIQYWR